MALITYDDKSFLNQNPDIPNENKVNDTDMNQIKAGVNTNETNIGTLQTDFTNATTYSTTETVIGTWLGKPLYRKAYTLNLSSANNETDTPIPNSIINNIDEVVTVRGNLKNTFGNWFPIPSVAPNGTLKNGISLYYNGISGIVLRIGDSSISTNSIAYAIIEYTKTTD